MRPTAGTGERHAYATAIAGLWSRLARTLSRLEGLAAEPGERLADPDAAETLPRLQYALHEAGELVLGIDPPPGAATAHAELAAALEDARDATAEVVDALEQGGAEAVAPLVHEWRGALFRVRLARMRLSARPPAAAAAVEEEQPPRAAAAGAAVFLVLAGAAAFTAGAVLAAWPLWASGLALVAGAILVFRP